jgi:copper(I)-binding protein
MKKLILAAIVSTMLAASAQAQVSVTAPWVRATVPAQKATGAFMQLQSATPARLVGVSSPDAANLELHKMEMTNNVMKMGKVDAIDLPAGKAVNLASGGYHVMLMGLKQQMKEGQVVELTLQVQGADGKRESVTVKMPVKPMAFVSPHAAQHAGH